MEHDKLKQAAIEAITSLFADTSVDAITTLDSLQEVLEEIQFFINTLKLDQPREEL